jgi:hypothetical protein
MSSQDSFDSTEDPNSTEDVTSMTMDLDDEDTIYEDWDEAPDAPPKPDYTKHWLVGIIWFRVMKVPKVGVFLLTVPPLALIALVTSKLSERDVNYKQIRTFEC